MGWFRCLGACCGFHFSDCGFCAVWHLESVLFEFLMLLVYIEILVIKRSLGILDYYFV